MFSLFYKVGATRNKSIKSRYNVKTEVEPSDTEKYYRIINAMRYRSIETIKKYLNKKTVRMKDESTGIYLLHMMAQCCLFYLFDTAVTLYDGDITKLTDCRGLNMLHFAAIGDNSDVIKYLVNTHYMDINTVNEKSGMTPLMYAGKYNSTNAMMTILELGGMISMRDKLGTAAYEYMNNEHTGESSQNTEFLVKLDHSI